MSVDRKTIENDEKYLRQISKVVSKDDSSIVRYVKMLEQYCSETQCFALASVQIGIPKRIIYLKNTTLDIPIDNLDYNESKILINPEIISRKGLTEFWEHCLSCPGYMGLVKRPYEMVIKYYDVNWNENVKKIEGFEATVLSHEMDHLDGILHMDIADEVLNMPNLDDRMEFRKIHGYNIISKTGDYEELLNNSKKYVKSKN